MFQLSESEQRYLLALARQAIETYLKSNEILSPPAPPETTLVAPQGAFVTLTKNHRLRGCIGMTMPIAPLYLTVIECAISAALRDPRFTPLEPHELAQTRIEISVLSPFFVVGDPQHIEVGKHGLMISKEPYRGLLLPQVATEYHWNREQFLEQTCIKAGLPRDAWRSPAVKIEAFTALVFSEESVGPIAV